MAATSGEVFVALSRDDWAKERLGEVYRKLFEGAGVRQGSSPDHFIYVTPGKARGEINELTGWIRDRFGDPASTVPAKTPFGYLSGRYDGWITFFAALMHGEDRGLAVDFNESVANMSWSTTMSRASPPRGFFARFVQPSPGRERPPSPPPSTSAPSPPSPSLPERVERGVGVKPPAAPISLSPLVPLDVDEIAMARARAELEAEVADTEEERLFKKIEERAVVRERAGHEAEREIEKKIREKFSPEEWEKFRPTKRRSPTPPRTVPAWVPVGYEEVYERASPEQRAAWEVTAAPAVRGRALAEEQAKLEQRRR